MSSIDWLVLFATLSIIVVYGMWKSRNMHNIQSYLLADRKLPWYQVGLSVMATQASAITFLSAPGQAYTDGLRFVQFYFGLPLAMIVLCITFVPIFHRLNVYTAYEFLEKRFDGRTRGFTAFLFLLQRGISTGITVYAPSLVLSALLGLPVMFTSILMSILVIIYTVYGGTKAVAHTQTLQMGIIFGGLIIAAVLIVYMLPEGVGISKALNVAGVMGKMNAIDTQFDWNNRYNLWSGIIGGFFLQLSYFGTDQSQVGRYLTGSSIAQSRLGLVMNGLVKIPMQFFILLIGILVFAFYQFKPAPFFFNQVAYAEVAQSKDSSLVSDMQLQFEQLQVQKQAVVKSYLNDHAVKPQLQQLQHSSDSLRGELKKLMLHNNTTAEADDGNYIFLRFVMDYLPKGLVGLLMAIIFLAAMGSTASGLNSLASTTMIDFYKRYKKKPQTAEQELKSSRWLTVAWGIFCLGVAMYAGQLGNLIEVVNILGSLFYGTILGIFLVAFYLKNVQGKAVFWAAVLAEIFVVAAWVIKLTAFLWLNLIGCVLVMLFAIIFQRFLHQTKAA